MGDIDRPIQSATALLPTCLASTTGPHAIVQKCGGLAPARTNSRYSPFVTLYLLMANAANRNLMTHRIRCPIELMLAIEVLASVDLR